MTTRSRVNPLDGTGRVALVVGGTAGIGYAAADLLSQLGATVFITGRNEDSGRQAADEIRATYLPADVSDTSSIDAAVDTVVKQAGRLDWSVNSAGVGINIPTEEMSDEDFSRVFDINVTGVFRCCRAVGRAMLPQASGSIVNIASMSGYIVNHPQYMAPYNASKAAVLHYTRSLAVEWGGRGIRVNSVSPGYTATRMTELSRSMPGRLESWKAAAPLKRIAEPSDIAGAVAYLLSDASSFVTGTDIVLDGGYRLW
ncbi:SDR family oxidoreductase [Microbacterium jejuense]|uniref:SDR family oxidoreductase n=1 Tax=Microbacterium jejuense TaxID=1263637 RepID=A0ABS7HL97_9MICO|nr:SDR family oxidoreductase [Microbacterium jejuense]MBW9093056.1 SDR family oxidoreductase [Microbacterium jejuense]